MNFVNELFDSFSWDDCYGYWRASTKGDLSIINKPLNCCKVRVNCNGENRIYTHIWLKNNQLYNYVNEFNKLIDMPLFSRDEALNDVRVSRSTELIVQSRSEEERAAIWIWVFCNSLENSIFPYPNNILIDYVGAKARIYLQETFQEWQFRYNYRFPFLFIDKMKVSNVKFENYKAIIDYAIFNAYMICKEYTITLFDSELGNEELPFSYRKLRK